MMEETNYKIENMKRKFLKTMRKKNFLEFMKWKDWKIKIQIEELFLKPIIVSIDDMDRSDKKEIKNIISVKNTWYDWPINYIPEPVRKSVGGFKDELWVFLKPIHLNKLCMWEERN